LHRLAAVKAEWMRLSTSNTFDVHSLFCPLQSQISGHSMSALKRATLLLPLVPAEHLSAHLAGDRFQSA
jgi:hypothetical protein